MKRQPLIVFSNSFLSLNTWTWIWIYRICDAPDLIDRSPILKTRSRSYDIDSYCLRGFSRRTIITIYITIYIVSISKEHRYSFKRAIIANRNRKQIFNNLNFWYSYVISSYSKFTFSLIQQRLIKLKINTCIYRTFIYIYNISMIPHACCRTDYSSREHARSLGTPPWIAIASGWDLWHHRVHRPARR